MGGIGFILVNGWDWIHTGMDGSDKRNLKAFVDTSMREIRDETKNPSEGKISKDLIKYETKKVS